MDFYAHDELLGQGGALRVAGLDEAGRGPIAGPVVAAAVVLPPGLRIKNLMDSKRLSARQRRAVFFEIVAGARDVGLGVAGEDEVDRINVLEATRQAMRAAVAGLRERPHVLVIDAVRLGIEGVSEHSPFKGESVSAAVAAASIVAKVARDALMDYYHGLYPEYGFDRHRGYGTREHMDAVRRHGPCPLHRKTFGGVRTMALPF